MRRSTIISSRGARASDIFEAFIRGAAPDGGLYMLRDTPSVADIVTRTYERAPEFAHFAAEILDRVLGEWAPSGGWGEIARRAFPFAPHIRQAGGHLLLELFHGPTCAFKDFGASFLATVLESELDRRGGRLVVLTATSGDTGGAVGAAFHGLKNIDVVILYPSGRISTLQEKQLTTLGDNVTAIQVEGTFDDCQRMVKDAFADEALSRSAKLTSANSINLGRLVPQSLYYLWTLPALRASGVDAPPRFCVPSGNFGNLTAGVMAAEAGMPTAGFLAATNSNDVVPDYLRSGEYCPRPSIATISNAMDVGRPSNFERLSDLFDGDVRRMAERICGESVDEETTRETMRRYREDYGLTVCPHTAVGLAAADRRAHPPRDRHPSRRPESEGAETVPGGADDPPSVVLATAHPGKFSEVVREATGAPPQIPERLRRALGLEGESVRMASDSEALARWLRRFSDLSSDHST